MARGVSVYEIDGPFFFGIATKFDEMMRTTLGSKPTVRIIRMRKVAFIDATALHNLETAHHTRRRARASTWCCRACAAMCARALSTPA